MNNKPNDWLVAQLDNPTFNFSNFKEVGLSADNTALQDRDKYKSSTYIQEKFKDENGKFNEAAFNKFYDASLASFQTFANDQFTDEVANSATWDGFDQLRDGQASKPKVWIEQVFNPDRLKTGVSRLGRIDNREWTASELAQKQKVMDYTTGEWKEYSPNDRTLFNNPFGFLASLSEPLVMAQWDEDGEHIDPSTNRRVKHRKGDYKYNDEGTYYYETLGGREPYGKQIKSAFDSFTIDGGWGNKYDFFDSDGLDKSVTGTVFKTAATLAPMFLGAPVALAYGAVMVGTQLLDILPMIYKTTIGIGDEADTPTANYIMALGRSFRQGNSEYAQQNLISTENFFNLVTDVALQWAQQRAIFSGIHKLLGTEALQAKAIGAATKEAAAKAMTNPEYLAGYQTAEKAAKGIQEVAAAKAMLGLEPLMKRRNRAAANVALGYMAMLQGSEVFEDALSQGASRTEAAAVTWGAIAGMYGIDRTGIGEIFFPELKPESLAIRKGINTLGQQISPIFKTATKDTDKKRWYARLFNTAKEKSHKYFQDVKNHNVQTLFGKMIGEGLEEVGEELMVDLSKATFNWASEMGVTSTRTKLDAWENMGERYAMNFFGGAVGGAIFGATDIARSIKKPSKQNSEELAYLIRNKKTGEIIEELDKMKKNGLLGNRNLSATKFEKDENGNIKWLSPTEEADNQNEASYRLIRGYIQSLDAVLNQNNMNLSDDQLLDKLIMSDVRMKRLLDLNVSGKMFQDFNTLATQIIDVEDRIKALDNEYNDQDRRGSKQLEYEERLNQLRTEKAELLAKRDKFYNGNYSKYYVGQMLFSIDNNINRPFLASNFRNYAEFKTEKPFEQISEKQLEGLREEYEKYKTSGQLDDLALGFDFFNRLNEKSSLKLEQLAPSLENFIKYKKQIKDRIFETPDIFTRAEEDITEEDFKNGRNIDIQLKPEFRSEEFTPIEGETVEQAAARQQEILDRNKAKFQMALDILNEAKAFGFIDSDVRKVITSILNENVNFRGTFVGTASLHQGSPEFNAFNFDSVQDAVQNLVSGMTLTNVQQIKDKVGEAIWQGLGPNGIDAIESYGYNFDDAYDMLVNEYQQIIDDTYNEYLSQHPEVEAITRELATTKENPIIEYIQEMAREIFDKELPIVDMLNDEKNRFKNVPSILDYVTDADRTKELEESLEALATMDAIIKASQVVETGENILFGHNQVVNEFLEKNFPEADKLGVIKADLAQDMLSQINYLGAQIQLLLNISRQNMVNRFAEHERTGKNMARMLYKMFSNKEAYQKLWNLEYGGIKLFDGVENIESPILDTVTEQNFSTADEAIFTELSKYQDRIYDNFRRMTRGSDSTTVISSLLSDIQLYFSNLDKQENTRLSSQTKNMTDYDYFIKLVTSMALRKSDFDYYLRNALQEDGVNFAPLESQQAAVELAIALISNPEVMNQALMSLKFADGKPGSELVKLPSIVMINGIGGAGKTSVIANLVNRIARQMDPSYSIWKAAPERTQVDNLNISLKTEGPSYTVEELMQQILPADVYGGLKNDIENSNADSKYFKIETYTVNGNKTKVARVVDTEYSDVNTPKVLFLDEVTHVNSLYLQHLSNWATQNGVAIIALGDLNQNGYWNGNISTYNIDSDSTLALRSPKIDISMRINNIQKNDNINNALAILDYVTYDETTPNSQMQRDRYKDAIKDSLKLKYFTDENTLLNGEKVVDTLSEPIVQQILDSGNKIGYVYDNPASPTYQMLKRMDNPNIVFYTKKSVQGSELDYFIIDTNWLEYNLDKDVTVAKDFMKDYYTLMTRSKKGTYFINNGLSEILGEDANVKQDYTADTPDPTQIIQDFRDKKLRALDLELEGYGVAQPEPEVTPSEEVQETTQETIPETKEETIPAEPETAETSGKSDETRELIEEINGTTTEDEKPIREINGVRVYGWYTRSGLRKEGDKYKTDHTAGILEDFNAVTTKDEIDQTEFREIAGVLAGIKSTILYGQQFDQNFLKRLESKYPNLASISLGSWNSGAFKIRVKKFDESLDWAVDKVNYSSSRLAGRASFDVVYNITDKEGKVLSFTIGKLTDPETWQAYIDKNSKQIPTEIKKLAVDFKKWYNKVEAEVLEKGDVRYYDMNKESITFNPATRLVPILKDGKRVKYSMEEFNSKFPEVMRSPIYIYAGKKGEIEVKDAVRGKAAIFVTSNKNLNMNGKPVTPNDLYAYYRLQRLNPEKYSPEVRMVVLDPYGMNAVDFFDINFKELGLVKGDEENKKAIKAYLGTMGSITTAARMFSGIWNYNAGLKAFLDSYRSFVNNPANSKYITNGLLNKQGITTFNNQLEGTRLEFRLTSENGAKDMEIMPVKSSVKGVKLENGVFITSTMAELQSKVLDVILDNINRLVELPKNRSYIIGQEDLKNIIRSITKSDKGNTTVYREIGNIVQEGFTGAGAFKLTSLLTALYKYISVPGVHTGRIVVEANKGKSLEFNIAEESKKIVDLFREAYPNVQPGILYTRLLTTVLQGNPNVGSTAKRTYSPFPNGIYYMPRYQSHTGNTLELDFYPAVNVNRQFYSNVAIESPTFEIQLPTSLPTEESTAQPISMDDINAIKRITQAFIDNLFKGDIQFDYNAVNLNDSPEFVRLREAQYSSIEEVNRDSEALKSLYITGALSAVEKGLAYKGMDRVLSATINPVTGVMKATKTLLTSKEMASLDVVEKTKKGTPSLRQFKDLRFEDGNNQNFTVTLKNGNSIKGKIEGTEVKFLPVSTYNIQMGRDSLKALNQAIADVSDIVGGDANHPLLVLLNTVLQYSDSRSMDLETRKALGEQALDAYNEVENSELGISSDEAVFTSGIVNEDGESSIELDPIKRVLNAVSTLRLTQDQQCKISLI